MTTTFLRRGAMAAVVFALAAADAGAQSLAGRIARVRDGTVRMSYPARPDVCGNGRGSITTRADARGIRSREWEDDCEPGPVRVALDIADRHVIAVRAYVGGRWRSSSEAVDLGSVDAREAVDYLLGDVVPAGGKGAREAIFPATIAEGVSVWPRLLAIARNENIDRSARTQAVFWVGQAAGEKASEGLREVAGEAKLDREVRLQAVFALSQHREGGVPALIDIARSSRDPEVKKQAIFWLGQSKDKRALDYFEAILTRR